MSITTPGLLAVRAAVAPWLDKCEAHSVVLVGCSGGADSLALAIALHVESKDREIKVIPVVVDHGLQENSAEVAHRAISELKRIGFTEIFSQRAHVTMVDGLEASARRARYQVFQIAIENFGAQYFFLGHTQDDQAESVLLGIARGSGTKSLSGMPFVNLPYIRPMISLSREVTLAACAESGVTPWEDPHNLDQRFARVRVRENILPLMEREIGPGISEALARSAKILRQDAEALDQWAAEIFSEIDPRVLDIHALEALPGAVRARVLRLAIYAAGAPSGSITADHLAPIEALVTDWKGQGATSLPGGVKVSRISGRLSLLNQP